MSTGLDIRPTKNNIQNPVMTPHKSTTSATRGTDQARAGHHPLKHKLSTIARKLPVGLRIFQPRHGLSFGVKIVHGSSSTRSRHGCLLFVLALTTTQRPDTPAVKHRLHDNYLKKCTQVHICTYIYIYIPACVRVCFHLYPGVCVCLRERIASDLSS